MSLRKQWVALAATIAAALAFVTITSAQSSFTVYEDGFGGWGSTIDSGVTGTGAATYGPPASGNTGTFAGHTIAAYGNDAIVSMNGADLDMAITTASHGSALEDEVAFAGTPITLGAGDWIEFDLTFTDVSNVEVAGGNDSLWMGLYNTGGVAPLSGSQGQALTNAGLNQNLSGGVQGWTGYFSQILSGGNGTSSKVFQRAAQSASQGDQDLLFNNASGGNTFNHPIATSLSGSSTSTFVATNGAVYTETFRVTNTGSGLAVTNLMYAGAGTGGAQLYALGGVTNSLVGGVTGFDGLAYGWNEKTLTAAREWDITSLVVTTDIPEPSSVMLLIAGLGLAVGLVSRRRS